MILNAIKIYGSEKNVLTVKLQDVLSCVTDGQECQWAILWVEAIGNPDDTSVLDLERQVRSSKNGYKIDWKSLIDFSNKIDQVIEILLIGDKSNIKLKRYSNNEEMYSNCYHTIELIDSSYWIIHTKSNEVLSRMKNSLRGAESI